jgi:hypothetical protein
MRNVLHSGTWKRLTCALALAAVATFIAPATGNAGPMTPSCGSNQQTWKQWYSDPFFENGTCQDVHIACPGEQPTNFCKPSALNRYYKLTCHPCYPN